MNVTATADLHGVTRLEIPESDVLVIAGDACPTESHSYRYQETWLVEVFLPWCDRVPADHVVWVAGNHDLVLEEPPEAVFDRYRVHYLQDSGIEIDGVKFWGSPWTKPVGVSKWAFSIGEQIDASERDQGWLPTLARSDTNDLVTMREHSRRQGRHPGTGFRSDP